MTIILNFGNDALETYMVNSCNARASSREFYREHCALIVPRARTRMYNTRVNFAHTPFNTGETRFSSWTSIFALLWDLAIVAVGN